MDRAEPNSISASDGLPAKSVLIVDDDQLVGRALSTLLAKGGYRPLTASNAAEALLHADGPLSAAVVDIHLPDMNGLELTQALRGKLGSAVPIFVLSGDTSMETIRALPDAGATYFFSKPVNADMLMQRIADAFAGRLSAT